MVTATSANLLSFRGKSGRIYQITAYISDVVGAQVLFSANGASSSTSPGYWRPPEAVLLYSASIITGPTVSVGMVMTSDGAVLAGTQLLYATFLNSLAQTPTMAIPFAAGTLIGANQF